MNVKASQMIGVVTLVAAASAPAVVMAQSAGGSVQRGYITQGTAPAQEGSSMQGGQQGAGMQGQHGAAMQGQQGAAMQGSTMPGEAQAGGMQGQQGSTPQGGQPSTMQPSPRGGGQQQAGAMSTRPIAINGHFTFPLASGCNYTADVRGSARPARVASGAEPLFTPDVVIDASVACPGAATIRVRENVSGARELSMAQIEEMIELRASLVSEASGAHCAYVPDFRLTPRALEGVGAALLCPLPAQAVRGGGPSSDENH